MKINILMSTYNGEKFLKEQIESIQKQTFTDWTLLIRDDGSSDKTIDIISHFEASDERIKLINTASFKNLGVIDSFFTLLKYEKADYYFFSDQDDVWLPNKIETMLEKAKNYSEDKPLLVYMDLKVVDQQLTVINESMIKSQSHHANTTLVAELTENTVTGGVSMINDALAGKWQTTKNVIMHDWYLALLASALGTLVYIDQPGELYRQHEHNVLGARTIRKRFRILKKGLSVVLNDYWGLIHDSQKQAKNVLEFSEDLSPSDKLLIEKYFEIDQLPFLKRVYLLKQLKLKKNKRYHTVVFWILIATNIYNR